MSLHVLDDYARLNLSARYLAGNPVFPLMLSVLNGNQDGNVFTDGKTDNYFVVSKFGFADLIQREDDGSFDDALYNFLTCGLFSNAKIRWYQVPERWVSRFTSEQHTQVALVERAQLSRINKSEILIENLAGFRLVEINDDNFDQVETELELSLSSRFFRSKRQFLERSIGVVAINEIGEIAAACYACAIENGQAEIDVFTRPTCRRQGLGKIVVSAFINQCINRQLIPHWDCYTNNISSLMLAKSLDFQVDNLYTHAVISK